MEKYDNKVLKTVLITHFSALGDVAMAIPIVYPVCVANPKVNFVLATRHGRPSQHVAHMAHETVAQAPWGDGGNYRQGKQREETAHQRQEPHPSDDHSRALQECVPTAGAEDGRGVQLYH